MITIPEKSKSQSREIRVNDLTASMAAMRSRNKGTEAYPLSGEKRRSINAYKRAVSVLC